MHGSHACPAGHPKRALNKELVSVDFSIHAGKLDESSLLAYVTDGYTSRQWP
jgi:hypothetical protein